MPGQQIGIIDDHAHPFPLESEPLDFASITLDVDDSEAGRSRRGQLAPGRLVLEAMRVRLAHFLGCAPEHVEDARAEAAQDWPTYVRSLFADVGVAGMLLDGGPHPVGPSRLQELQTVSGIRTWSLFRIEAVLDPLIEQGLGAEAILAAVSDAVAAAAAAGAVGCKTVLAYRTGLAVDAEATLADARRSLESGSTEPARRRGKALRDLVLRRTMAQCGELGLPLQVHTGFGDSDLRLVDADPLGLDDVLRTPEGRHASVVLIHAAYPWHEKVAYLAAVRSSVWAEFSLVNLLSPATSAQRLLKLIELAPTGRILVGSDGHGAPETHWFALRVLRRAWAEVRDQLGGITRESWLDGVEEAIFAGNARELYRLPIGELGVSSSTSMPRPPTR
jgi:predicted TIM-barrel fold metal-dependent hydrolase